MLVVVYRPGKHNSTIAVVEMLAATSGNAAADRKGGGIACRRSVVGGNVVPDGG